jgi:hypothetical protein
MLIASSLLTVALLLPSWITVDPLSLLLSPSQPSSLEGGSGGVLHHRPNTHIHRGDIQPPSTHTHTQTHTRFRSRSRPHLIETEVAAEGVVGADVRVHLRERERERERENETKGETESRMSVCVRVHLAATARPCRCARTSTQSAKHAVMDRRVHSPTAPVCPPVVRRGIDR